LHSKRAVFCTAAAHGAPQTETRQTGQLQPQQFENSRFNSFNSMEFYLENSEQLSCSEVTFSLGAWNRQVADSCEANTGFENANR
jgi:hypothetical protein